MQKATNFEEDFLVNRQRKSYFLPILCVVSIFLFGMIDNSQLSTEKELLKIQKQNEVLRQQHTTDQKIIDSLLQEKESLQLRKSKSSLIDWVCENSKTKDRRMATLIVNESLKTKHAFLLLALFKTESEFYPKATSRIGAKGLGQITSIWVPDLKKAGIIKKESDLYNPVCNIKATEYVITVYLQETGGKYKQTLDLYLGCAYPPYSNTILKDRSYLKMKHKSLIVKT